MALRGSSYYAALSWDAANNKLVGKNFVGLAAKGNIVIGDYTNTTAITSTGSHNNSFDNVIEMIDHDGIADVTGPYQSPDGTDAALGYGNADPSLCGGKSPCFSGDYTANDGGQRCVKSGSNNCASSTSRKFYESSLDNDVFHNLVQWGLQDPIACFGGENTGSCASNQRSTIINATLFTNHAIIGDVGRSSWSGAWIARDDALQFQGRFDMQYDWRLQDPEFVVNNVQLPMDLNPTSVVEWHEVPPQ